MNDIRDATIERQKVLIDTLKETIALMEKRAEFYKENMRIMQALIDKKSGHAAPSVTAGATPILKLYDGGKNGG